MSHPEILRHSGPHTVEVAEGTKVASRRQPQDRHAWAEPALSETDGDWIQGQSGCHSEGTGTQLSAIDVDASDIWTDDEALTERLERLRVRNRQMTQRLQQISHSTSGEDSHE